MEIAGFLRSCAILLLTLAASVASALAGAVTRNDRAAVRVMRWWGRWFLRIGGWPVRVLGGDRLPEGGVVLVANHQSLVDIPLCLAAFPREICFIAKRELGRIPLFGRAMRAAGNLFIDREDPRDAVHLVRQARGLLERGRAVVVFPEGTRSDDGSIGEFRPGAFHIAWKTGSPLVPVYLAGGRQALPKGSLLVQSAELVVRVLPPVSSGTDRPASRDAMALESRRSILAAKAEEERPVREAVDA
ncbi:MAG: lysophospholipid acyltransferase family protein [Deltaproteobacteria bacterium]